MINQNNRPTFIVRFTLFLLVSALVLLISCSPSNFPMPPEQPSLTLQATPAIPILPTQTEIGLSTYPNPAPAITAESGTVALGYPEPIQDSGLSSSPSAMTKDEAEAALAQAAPLGQSVPPGQHPIIELPEMEVEADGSLRLEWGDLIPADFTSEAIYQRYQTQIADLTAGDPKIQELQIQMQEEFNNAPTNASLNGQLVRVPGFVTPLDYADTSIQEFLLVPYFGACIHVPPPPVNQTVFVSTATGDEIAMEDSFGPIWVTGILQTESTDTDLATAGYTIVDAKIELYNGQP